MNNKPIAFQFKIRTVLLLFVLIALVLVFGIDRYKHARECQKAFASLAQIGLNHEFDSASSGGNQVFFYSTSSHIDPSNTREILRHLKTVSREYNSIFRFGYGIQRIDFKNAELDSGLIDELRFTFPNVEISRRKSIGE